MCHTYLGVSLCLPHQDGYWFQYLSHAPKGIVRILDLDDDFCFSDDEPRPPIPGVSGKENFSDEYSDTEDEELDEEKSDEKHSEETSKSDDEGFSGNSQSSGS